MSQQPTVCRRCSECEGQDHHWNYYGDEDANGEPVLSCKHCDATCPFDDADDLIDPDQGHDPDYYVGRGPQ